MDAPHDDGRRVVFVHDWLTGMRGGEKCLEVLCHHWPAAELFTLLHAKGRVSPIIERRRIHTSPLQWLPGVLRYYRYLLPTFPLATAAWRLPKCELVVSFSHCIAKAARPPAGVPHVCYCFTPMRYAWHLRDAYFAGRFGILRPAVRSVLAALRAWDRAVSDRVSHFVAISRTVQARIADCYGRDSQVIYPPVDTEFFRPIPGPREDYYLAVSAFAPYKRLDLAIDTCNRLKRKLIVVGRGQDEGRLRALAGPTVHVLGWQSNEAIRAHLCRCRALLFPGEEDFGIVPVEAMACGTPVLAFGRGGATESIVPPGTETAPTGLFFAEQTVEAVTETIQTFEAHAADFTPTACRRQAMHFTTARFAREFVGLLESVRQRQSPAAPRRAA